MPESQGNFKRLSQLEAVYLSPCPSELLHEPKLISACLACVNTTP